MASKVLFSSSTLFARGQLKRNVPCQRLAVSTRCFSSAMDRIGLGASKWRGAEYPTVVRVALQNGVTTLEAGTEGGEAALAQALEPQLPSLQQPIECIIRVGYRTIPAQGTETSDEIQGASFTNDVVVDQEENRVLHNVGPDYVSFAINDSPLQKLAQDYPDQVQLVALLHNPEEQRHRNDDDDTLRNDLSASFAKMQEMVDHGPLHSYGIVSNGLGLPSQHPLNLSWSQHVKPSLSASNAPDFRVLQYPYNLMETNSLHEEIRGEDDFSNVQLYAMRPLACYPDRGTGSGHPFVLRDYLLPATMSKEDPLQWSHQMKAPPACYETALRAAMGHFDAEEILELKSKGEELDTDQRETLDGCKLLQSLLHDVDQGLGRVRSFAAHEEFLLQNVIPLIHDTFESYDDDSARVLEMFFGAYTLAVKHAIARNVRNLMVNGEEGKKGQGSHPDLPESMRLQEYALRQVWKESRIDKIVLGASKPEYVMDTTDIVRTIASES